MTRELTFPRAPAHIIERLQAAEVRQRYDTRTRGLNAEPVNVEGLLLLARNLCACGCKEALDFVSEWDEKSPPPGYPVIAHVFLRKRKGEHTPENVRIWRHGCNQRMAATEKRDVARGDRMTVQRDLTPLPREERLSGKIKGRTEIAKRGFQKPDGHKTKWPKRKVGQ